MNKTRKIDFLPDRLRDAMKEQRHTRATLCAGAGIAPDTFAGYMRTGRIMPDALEKICQFMDIDAEYLAGLTDINTGYEKNMNEVNRAQSVEYAVRITKAELYELLFTMYEYPAEVIKEVRTAPAQSWAVRTIENALLDLLENARAELIADASSAPASKLSIRQAIKAGRRFTEETEED